MKWLKATALVPGSLELKISVLSLLVTLKKKKKLLWLNSTFIPSEVDFAIKDLICEYCEDKCKALTIVSEKNNHWISVSP